MKRIMALTLSLAIVFSFLFQTTVYAAGRACKDHDYDTSYDGKEFVSDICQICGYMRVHKTPYALPFITRANNVVARKAPRKASKVVKTYADFGTELRVVGRIRNEYNNLWLLLSDGTYIFADNTAFSFDSIAKEAVSSVNLFAGPNSLCYVTYSPKYGLTAQCTPSVLGIYGSMFVHFMPGGTFDLKRSDILGSNTYDYYVYADGGIIDKRYTGEELGNILYGYACKNEGISQKMP